MIMAASKMIHTTRKGGAVEHLAMSSDTPSLCGRVTYGTADSTRRLCKACAKIAGIQYSANVNDWTDLERTFIHLPREAGQWQMLQDVVDDYAKGMTNQPRRIALYQAALAARNTATTVITNHSDSRMINKPNNGVGGFGKEKRIPGATENQRIALRKMGAYVDSLFVQLFDLKGTEYAEAQKTFTVDSMTDEYFDKLTRTEIDKAFKVNSELISRLKLECGQARDAKRVEERKTGKAPQPAEDGYYVYGDTFVCAKWNRAHTGQYATVWSHDAKEWEWDGKTSYKLMADIRAGKLSKVTPEDAARFGDLYGRCMRCSRKLTDANSIEMAMGKTCAGKMGW